ncbi:MAG: class I SAM-dependent methyltransferase [Candidatus Sericytochromatia bacterium]
MSNLTQILQIAISSRSELLEQLHNEKTFAYRLFHGINEGYEGLTIDRYGQSILIQTFRNPLIEKEVEEIKAVILKNIDLLETKEELFFTYNPRALNKESDISFDNKNTKNDAEKKIFKEIDINYIYQGKHRGQDPFLFLDMRAGRRFVLKNAKNKSFLNLFSYTNSAGICAKKAGAKEVINVDFSSSSLAIGLENAQINDILSSDNSYKAIKSDVFYALRKFTDTPFKGWNSKIKLPEILDKENLMFKRTFDMVFLDPPAWSKSPYGTIDLVRDYQSIFKLALLATSEGGRIIAANNVAKVQVNDWIENLKKCAKKIGREIKNIDIITPETDFPSPDKNFPLKLVVCEV